MRQTRTALLMVALAATVACQEATPSAPELAVPQFSHAPKVVPPPRPQTWVDGELFNGVVTPAHFDPTSDAFDELYAGGNGFKDDKPLISESKPGDQDYNGGRWHLNVLKGSVDPDKYANADKFEDLDVNDFMSTDVYFECPLLPRRGRN